VPDPLRGGCDRPYHSRADRNFGGPHDHVDAMRDIAGGRMNGFVASAESGRRLFCHRHVNSPACSLSPKKPDVMGYHTAKEIPNYWSYARHFVLQDHMFEPSTSWSLPAHLDLVSGWSAKCARPGDPTSCKNAVQAPGSPPGEPQNRTGAVPDYAWTDLTYLLHRAHVPWRYYVFKGLQPDCADGEMFCKQVKQNAKIQQQAIALRGKVTYLADLPSAGGSESEQAGRRGRGQGNGQAGQGQGGQQLGPPEGRAWVYWADNVKLE